MSLISGKGWRLEIGTNLCDLNWCGPNIIMKASSTLDIVDVKEVYAADWKHQTRGVSTSEGIIPGCNTLISDTFVFDCIELKRQVSFDREDLSNFNIRLLVRNGGSVPLKLRRFIPILIQEPEELKIGGCKASEWAVLRQGRHKNDLPSICVLGEADIRYMDALKGLSESGTKIPADDKEIPLGIVSDELTVIKGNKGKGPGSVLFGFLTSMSQLVECQIVLERSREKLEKLELSCLMDGIIIEPGEERAGEWLRIDGGEETFQAIDKFTHFKAEMSNTYAEPDPPSVYCTWYYYGPTISGEDIKEELIGLKEREIPVDVFQIDDGWQRRWGDWEPNEKFPFGMRYVAEEIESNGYRPGIWTCPFLIEPMCEIRYYHPDWILRTGNEMPVKFKMAGMDNYVLDVTHPEVQTWIERLYAKLTYEWGFTYHKLDFTRAVVVNQDAVFYNKRVTRAEAYRMGIEAVRRGAGPDAYISICGGLYGASSGLANAQRTGSDVLSKWPDKPEGSDELVAPYTIKQNVLRYWMNHLWHNDPDALMVRRRTKMNRNLELSLGLLTDDEAVIYALNQYLGGGVVCFSEPMREIDRDRIGLLRHIIPSIGKAAVPRDMFSEKRYPCIYDVEVTPKAPALGRWHTVVIINWKDVPVKKGFTLDESTVGEFARMHQSFSVSEFWSRRIWDRVKRGDRIELGEMRPHSAILLKVIPQEDSQPSLLYSNGHFSMGGTEIRSWEYSESKLKVGIEWPWNYPVEFIIQAAKGKRWVGGNDLYKISFQDERRAMIQLRGRYSGVVELTEG